MLCVTVEDEPRPCQLEGGRELAVPDEKLDAWMIDGESDVWTLDKKLELCTLEDVFVKIPEDKLSRLSKLD